MGKILCMLGFHEAKEHGHVHMDARHGLVILDCARKGCSGYVTLQMAFRGR